MYSWSAARFPFLILPAKAGTPANPATSPASSKVKVPGSGTADTPAPTEMAVKVLAIGEPVSAEPNNWLAPAPTLKLDPLGRAAGLSAISVPACTFVPPP